jgi:hypothetical protein
MVKRCGPPSHQWRTFLRNHARDIAAMDMFIAPTLGFDLLYGIVVLGEALRQILRKYAAHYNELRTHRSLNKDAPIHRAVHHRGGIVSVAILAGLHHHYCRI